MQPSDFNPRRYRPKDRAGRDRVDYVMGVAESLTVWEGPLAGEPLKLAPFQEAILSAIYGPSRPDGAMLVRDVRLWLPTGSAKTVLVAVMALAHAYRHDGLGVDLTSEGGQIKICASDRKQAGLAFGHAHNFAMDSPLFDGTFRARPSEKELYFPQTKTQLQALSSEAYSKEGLAVSLLIADEVHAWQVREGQLMWDVLRKSRGKRRPVRGRPGPLSVAISTAGTGHGHLAANLWAESERWQREKNDTQVVFFAGVTNEEWNQWNKAGKKPWRRTSFYTSAKRHPGVAAGFKDLETLAEDIREAVNSPTALARLKRYELNIWQLSEEIAVIPDELWATQPDPEPIEPGAVCSIGIDIGRVGDPTAVCAAYPDMSKGIGERTYQVRCTGILSRLVDGGRHAQDRADYRAWADSGWIREVGEQVLDQDIVDLVLEIGASSTVERIILDPYDAYNLQTLLEAEGFEVITQRQSEAWFAPAVNATLAAIKSRRVAHDRSPYFSWNIANTRGYESRLGNMMLSKGKSPGRIDATFALVMSMGYWEARMEMGTDKERRMRALADWSNRAASGEVPMVA